MFYYLNGRFPLTNGLLIDPDGEVPEGKEKINLKQFYKMFKDTNSHGLVSLQFLCALGIFFGVDKSIPQSAITEFYKNLSHEILSELNIKRKEEDNESNLKIKNVIFSSGLVSLRKNWWRIYLSLSNIKNIKKNFPTLSHKFRMLKQ